jgi:hypothetical protein
VIAREAPGVRMINDSTELAHGLRNGGFCILRWELTGLDSDLAHWKKCLQALCDELDTGIEFIDIPRKNLTVVVNVLAVPPDWQVQNLIAAIDELRWLNQKP